MQTIFSFKYSITYLETLQYSVYDADKKGHYSMHSDAGFKGVNNDSRKISFSCLLNDPSEFEGGDSNIDVTTPLVIHSFQLKKYEICFLPCWMPTRLFCTKAQGYLVGWVHGLHFV